MKKLKSPAKGSEPWENTFSNWLKKCKFPVSGTGTPLSCAVSGGADSTALALLAKASGYSLQIIHIDHGLRKNSAKDAKFVSKLAKKLDARFICLKVNIKAGSNLEARARKARYEALDSIDPDALLGHTADDQAETVLLNLLWGSGPEGMAGMRHDQRRPILNLRRKDTEEICRTAGIAPLFDSMNDDPSFRRNRIRSEVIPLLNEISGKDIVPVLCRSSHIFRQTSDFLNELTSDIDPTDARAIKNADPLLASWTMKRWLSEASPPDFLAIERVLAVARGEITATEIPGGHRVSRSAMRLRLNSD